MALSEARRRANAKYNKAHIKSVGVKFQKTDYAVYAEYAQKHDLSFASLVKLAVKDYVQHDRYDCVQNED